MSPRREDLGSFLGCPLSGKRHREKRTLARKGGDSLERGTADEIPLVHLDREIEPDLGWRRVEIRVLPDQDVPLLEAEELEGVEPVRLDVEVEAGVEQGIPERLGLAAGVVQFVAELTDEADA